MVVCHLGSDQSIARDLGEGVWRSKTRDNNKVLKSHWRCVYRYLVKKEKKKKKDLNLEEWTKIECLLEGKNKFITDSLKQK